MEIVGAYILAGGKSSRMGSEKGLVEINNVKFIEHVIHAVKKSNVCGYLGIISNTKNYHYLNIEIREDIIKNCGPLGGIYTALMYSPCKYNIILSCDIPFVKHELLTFLFENINDRYDCLVPVSNDRIEPLCGLYSKKMIDKINTLILCGRLSVLDALREFRVKYLPIDTEFFYEKSILQNINSPFELSLVNQGGMKSHFS